MGIYLALPFFVLLLGFITNFIHIKNDPRKYFLFCSYLILFLVMGLRNSSVGADNRNYTNLFYMIGQAPFGKAITKIIPSAPIYCLYNKLLYLICPHAIFFSLCNALIACICTAIFFYRFSKNVIFSVYLHITTYLYLASFNMTRQYLALSLTLLAACLMDENKVLKAIVVMLLAVGIHNTALIMLPIIPLIRVKITPKIALIAATSSVALFLFMDLLYMPFIHFFVKIFPRYQMYLGSSKNYITTTGRGNNIYLKLFYLLFVIIAYYIMINKRKTLYPDSDKVSKFLLIISIGLVMGMSNAANIVLGRFFKYFEIYLCCFIPNIIECFGKRKFAIYYWCYLLLWLPYLICLSRNMDRVIPYSLM